MMMEERMHGDVKEHKHAGYEYWHPAARVHSDQEEPEPRGLQVKPFDWASWDAGCHAKDICQGYSSLQIPITDEQLGVTSELHHRIVAPNYMGIAEVYWQCPHCRQLQKPIQWAQGARFEKYNIATRGNRVVLWIKVSITHHTVQAVASYEGCNIGTAYVVGNYPPQQLPNEIAVTLARRFWHKITKGAWSDVPKEELDRLSEDIKTNKIEKIRSIIRRLGGTATHTKLLRDSHLVSKEFIDGVII